MRSVLLSLLIILLSVSTGMSQAMRSMSQLDLSGTWNIEQVNGTVKTTGAMPGGIHSALYENGIIVDPYYGTNEEKIQWVAEQDWIVSREFEVDPSLLAYQDIYLEIKNPDTFCEFKINGKLVGTSDNMFCAFKTLVKEQLQPGKNTIEILFKSPLKVATQVRQEYDRHYPSQQGDFNYIRKVQCHNGWDWGIKMPVSGITDEIFLTGVNGPMVEMVYTDQKHAKGVCTVEVNVELSSQRQGQTKLKLKLADQEKDIICNYNKGINKFQETFTIVEPKLWWPAGYGDQNLYELEVINSDQIVKRMLGLRKLELVNEDDKYGTSMMFRINDVDVFCKGANWIPCDAFMNRQTDEKYEYLLSSAVDANMNMIRAWGGGYYERDIFYQTCDKLGLLVWQDMMFSCATYPAGDKYLESVKKEIEYQTKRLYDRPSVVIWCGDNECVGAIGWFDDSKNDRPFFEKEWSKLNDARSGAFLSVYPDAKYWPSSPCDGKGLGSDGWTDDTKGDMHYWEVWHGGKAFDAFYEVKPRFCSEFGYQSLPSMESVESFAPKDQLDVESEVFTVHQKSKGNHYIIEMFERYFHSPKDFESTLYLSQLQQAKAIKTACEHWRSTKPVCQGTLFWQLNDNWPVCSWSSIEYNGNWKQLQYQARRFYAPVMSCAIHEKDHFNLYCVSDLLADARTDLDIMIYDFDGKLIKELHKNMIIPKQSSTAFESLSPAKLEIDPKKHFAVLKTTAAADGKIYSHENTLFFTEEKNCGLMPADIKTEVSKVDDNYQVTLTTDKPAFFVTLETPGIKGIFSDNSFTLMPNEPKTITFRLVKYRSEVKFEEVLRVMDLRETYNTDK